MGGRGEGVGLERGVGREERGRVEGGSGGGLAGGGRDRGGVGD